MVSAMKVSVFLREESATSRSVGRSCLLKHQDYRSCRLLGHLESRQGLTASLSEICYLQ